MRNGAVFGIMLMLISVSFLSTMKGVQPAKASPTTITVPDDYPTVQEAINHANEGDTVFVRAGTYAETIVVDKPLTLRGESKQNTTLKIKWGQKGYSLMGFRILASNVTLTGFRITYNMPGVMLVVVDGRSSPFQGIIVEDNILESKNADTMVFWSCSRSRICGNTIYTNEDGSCLGLVSGSSFNTVDNNTFVGGCWGVGLGGNCTNNVISNNVLRNQTYDPRVKSGAMDLTMASNNVVEWNDFENNEVGMTVFYSSGNRILHNNFINNSHQVLTRELIEHLSDGSSNIWDDGYPGGGNYWSDYAGQDLLSGPYQNETGSDGRGDIPYVIDSLNLDRYPLMKPLAGLLGDLNNDHKVDLKDIYIVESAFGSYPGHERWNSIADLNQDEKVDLKDFVIICKNYGKTEP